MERRPRISTYTIVFLIVLFTLLIASVLFLAYWAVLQGTASLLIASAFPVIGIVRMRAAKRQGTSLSRARKQLMIVGALAFGSWGVMLLTIRLISNHINNTVLGLWLVLTLILGCYMLVLSLWLLIQKALSKRPQANSQG